jgi:Cu(I)/Ag(I) efflux system membrane fusion protein/cobalt-zinc-cadmium efflux system membrane fusion protein
MKNYRSAFWLAVAGNLFLAGVLGSFWWRSRSKGDMPAVEPVASTMPATAGESSPASAMPADPALAPIPLSSPRMQGVPLSFGKATRKAVRDEIRTTGNVVLDESRLAYVQLQFSGWIRKVFVGATFQYAQQGAPLFTIYSPDVVATEREYLVALENQRRLLDGTVPGVTAGAGLTTAALDRLRRLGVPAAEIERLQSSAQVQDEIEIGSPVSGHVIEREALPNKFVEPNTRLYTIADLSTVWVVAQVFQSDLGRIRKGDTAVVSVDAQSGKSFTGQVDFIYPDVDLATRTTRVRLVLPNPNLALAPGMFANVIFHVSMGEQVTIPASGVLQSGMRSVVFVDDGKGYLQPREVELGPRVGDDFVVAKGLRGGERIITSANFLIDSEAQLQTAAGAFMPPPPGAGQAAATNAPAQAQASAELTTDPSPPQKGSNTVRVKLTDQAGKPVAGAEVTATFFMPAMPAMGMAAMRTVVKTSDKGGGTYEGKADLGSGGTWQVTITASQNGQTIVNKQLTVTPRGHVAIHDCPRHWMVRSQSLSGLHRSPSAGLTGIGACGALRWTPDRLVPMPR